MLTVILCIIKGMSLPVVKWVGDIGGFSVDDNNAEVFHLSYINKTTDINKKQSL